MGPTRQRWTLVAACIAQFMILLDITIVNVALPSIQGELAVSTVNLEWVVNAYVLTLASLILVGGGLGDRFGRKRWLVVGFVVFTVFSAACALSSDDPELIAFRALQGVGAALLAPLALSILVDAFPPERRSFAIGIWAGVAGVGFGLGPVVGGLLIAAFAWPAVFWVNVPIGIAGAVVALLFVRDSRDPAARRLDLVGAMLVAGGLFSLTFALVETDDHGWLSWFTLSFLGAGIVLLAGFVAYEAHHPEPMLPLQFFRRRRFAAANATYALLYGGFAATLFFVTLLLQNVHGYSALETGLAWFVLNIPFLIVAPLAGRIQRRFGGDRVVAAGPFLGGVGILGLAFLGAGTPFWAAVPSLLLMGVGFGLAVPGISTIAMGAIEAEHAGVASGVLNSSRQVGSAVGLAAIGSISVAVVTSAWNEDVATLPAESRPEALSLGGAVTGGQVDEVDARLGAGAGQLASDAFVSGYRAAMLVAGGLALLSCVFAFLGSRPASPDRSSSPT